VQIGDLIKIINDCKGYETGEWPSHHYINAGDHAILVSEPDEFQCIEILIGGIILGSVPSAHARAA
tara:strand:- start:486 stop:683 length:198 start_codon:yes stop_codon:yes gene_type:complete